MRRALVVGSQIEGLRGVENDTRLMEEMLRSRGFEEVDRRTGDRATRAGILAGYDALIEASNEGDAAVVYYSGHGFHATLASERLRSWQCIAPTDLRASGTDDWRGITAWELSIKQAQLTAKTKNVTVILDCCSSSQMSRNSAAHHATARALPHPLHTGFEHHLAALRAQYGAAFDAVAPAGNPHAVRLVACGETESAFESPDGEGTVRGAFTSALLDVLQEVGDAPISWSVLSDAIRARVLRTFIHQRPDVEGPKRRRLFSLTEDDDSGGVAIGAVEGGFLLQAGRLTGVTKGDVYGVMPVGSTAYDFRRAIAKVEVTELLALTSRAERRQGSAALPVDAVAFPIVKNAIRRAVALEVPGSARAKIEQAIGATATLRLATPEETGAVATLRLAGDALTIEDSGGPLFPEARFPDGLAAVIKNIANLGVAQGIRELEGAHGVFANELAIELGTIEGNDARALPEHGGALGLQDRIYVKIATRAHRRLYVHVFNIGLRGKVTLLTDFAPAGVALDSGDPPFILGKAPNGEFIGLGLTWPEGLPKETFPRVDEIIVIATTAKTSLASLETQEAQVTKRSPGNKLVDLLAQLQDGVPRDAGDGPPIDGFLVKRLSYELHPRDTALAGVSFEIDENSGGHAAARDPGAWIATRDGAAPDARVPAPAGVPDAIAIRLVDLEVEEQGALGSSDLLRIDALICARSATGVPSAWTQRLASTKASQRLLVDPALLFLGSVRGFVEVALFVSRDAEGSSALFRLLESRAASQVFKDAARSLSLVAGAGAGAEPWVAAAGASAVFSRMAYELLRGVAGKSVGLYRTSFLAGERFGAGRHPEVGRYRAQGISFSLEIERVEHGKPKL